MDGNRVATMHDVVASADIFITATGCFGVITAEHLRQMKNKAIVGNIGYFDNEIDIAGPYKADPATDRPASEGSTPATGRRCSGPAAVYGRGLCGFLRFRDLA
jgi:S-adenosylhomocysteine hydrolase